MLLHHNRLSKTLQPSKYFTD